MNRLAAGGVAAFVSVAALAVAGPLGLGVVALSSVPAVASPSVPTGPCGPASQPCTWNFAQSNVYSAQAPGQEGAGVLVAVVDAWVDPNHPDFGNRVVDEADCVGGTCKDHLYDEDACDHGTHVAGTIASSSYGVAPKADILAIQVLTFDPASGECSGSTTDVAAGIAFAVAHHARIINLSLGDLLPLVTQSSAVTTAVRKAAAAGAVVVIAAGNESLPLTDSYGSSAVLVAATGPGGGLASYSDSYGSVALAAPGGDSGPASQCQLTDCILSTFPGGAYGLLEGTSMAAADVSGAAALLLGEHPSWSATQVVHALEATARPLTGSGYGVLDAGAALALSPPAPPSTTTAPHSTPATELSAPGTATTPKSTSPATAKKTTPSTQKTALIGVPTGVCEGCRAPPPPVRLPVPGPIGRGHSDSSSAVPAVGTVAAILLAGGAALAASTLVRRRPPPTSH